MEKKNYKPFDIEKAKAGAKIMTKAGRTARIICTDLKGGYPLVVALTEQGEDGEVEYPYDYTIDGCFHEGAHDNDYDLVMCFEKHEGWMNLYKSSDGSILSGDVHSTRAEAEENVIKALQFVTTIKIEWEE